MKVGLLPLIIVTAVLMAAAAIVVFTVGADTGGGGASLEGYFTELNTVQSGISSQYADISGQYPNAFSSKQETLDYLSASADVWADGVAKLDDMDPPGEAEGAHATLVQATDDVRAAFEELGASAEAADDTEEAMTALLDSADTTAFDDYSSACSSLQTLADDSGVAVQLAC